MALRCPQCRDDRALATVERLEGAAECSSIEKSGPVHSGYTHVNWDSSTTIGVTCRSCMWEQIGDDWIGYLKEPGEEDENGDAG
jgi:hypothetical protein